jgi:hypothetical protein
MAIAGTLPMAGSKGEARGVVSLWQRRYVMRVGTLVNAPCGLFHVT